MSLSDLKRWPIFNLLQPEFLATIQMALVYGDSGNEALIVTKDDMIYGLGCNINGCLGTGDACSTLSPKIVDVLCKKGIKTFAHGGSPHVLALTHEGKIYFWGHITAAKPSNRSLTHKSVICNSTPVLIELPLKQQFVVDIACGNNDWLALTNIGEVYHWSKYVYEECITEYSEPIYMRTNNETNVPSKVNSALIGKKVTSISCGQNYNMAVTDYGEVYSWGHNDVGQLGIDNKNSQTELCKVINLVGIVIEKIVCGYAHTLALSNRGVLYVWGSNGVGQLGLGNKTDAWAPVKLSCPEMGRVSEVAALYNSNISAAIGNGNKVFMWGQCLGQSVNVPTFTPLASFNNVFASYATPSTMHRPLILYAEEEMSIIDCLKQAFNDEMTSDLTIRVQEKPIHVHKAVLKIRSQYFRAMFQEHWEEYNQSVIEHNVYSYNVYRSFLKYLYTDELDLPSEDALELLDLANAYFEMQLKKRCFQVIEKGITILNVAYVYSAAIKYDSQELKEFCLKFALSHMTEVVQTPNFAKLDESTVKTFIIEAAKAGAFKK